MVVRRAREEHDYEHGEPIEHDRTCVTYYAEKIKKQLELVKHARK
jgi:hypothetical protein